MNYILQSTKEPATNVATCYYRFASKGLNSPELTETSMIKLVAPIYISGTNFPPDTPTRYLMSLPGVPYYDGAFVSGGGYEWVIKRLRGSTWTTFSLVAQGTTLGTNQAKIFNTSSENGMKIEIHNGSITTGDYFYFDGYFINTGLSSDSFLNYNTIYGSGSNFSNITGSGNTFSGYQSGYSNTSGSNNVISGYLAGYSNTTAEGNVFVGKTAGYKTLTGGSNVYIGMLSGYDSVEAVDNVFLGYASGQNNTSGSENCFLGKDSGDSNTTGGRNVFLGMLSGHSNIGGSFNLYGGYQAAYQIAGGNYNVYLGYQSGVDQLSGDNVICIGKTATPSTTSISNEITLGNASITSFRCQVELTVLSDARDKTDIQDLKEGLEFINKINPKTYYFDKRDWYDDGIPTGEKKENKISAGILAQDLLEFDTLNIVNKNNPEKLEVTNSKLIFPLINAVKELSKQVNDLKKEIEVLKNDR